MKMNPKPIESSDDDIPGVKLANRKSKSKRNVVEEDFRRDDLKFRTMAQYKAVKEGDVLMFDEIDRRAYDLAAIKGKALEDSEFEEEEREIDEMLDEEKKDRKQEDKSNYGRRSDNSELLKSVHSDKNYWQRIDDKAKRKRVY